jgi:hopanoid biosynthesis associated RND transporter like protein HpnN
MKTALQQALIGLVEGSTRHAAAVVAAALLACAGALYYTVGHLAFDTNTIDMLDARLPFRQHNDALDRHFPVLVENAVVVIEAATEGDAEDAQAALAERLRARPDLFSYVFEPGSDEFFDRNGLLYLGVRELQDLADRLAEAQPLMGALARDQSLRGLLEMFGLALDRDLEPETGKMIARLFDEIAAIAGDLAAGRDSHASWQQQLIGAEDLGKRRFVLAQPVLDYASLQPGKTALDHIRALGRDLTEREPGLSVRLTGAVAIEDEELAGVSVDAARAGVLSFALVCLATIWGLRSIRVVAAVLATLAIGLTWVGAFATAAIGALNLISVNFAVLFIGMGVDFGIQFAMRFQEEHVPGRDRADSLARAARGVGGALTLAAVAAAVCFFAFVPTSYRGLAELGVIAGWSMFIALFTSLTVLPALLSLLAPGAGRAGATEGRSGGMPIRARANAILALTCVAVVAIAVLAPRARFDFNPLSMRDPTTESVSTFTDLLADPDTTPYTASVLAPDLEQARALARRLDALPEVDKALTAASFVPEDQDDKRLIIEDLAFSLGPDVLHPPQAEPPDVMEEAQAIAAFRRRLEPFDRDAAGTALGASAGRLAAALDAIARLPGWPEQVLPELRGRVIADLPQAIAKLGRLLAPGEITLESLPEALRVRYLAGDGTARIEVFPAEDLRDNGAMRRFVDAVQAVAPNATDSPVNLVEGGDAVVEATLEAAFYALVAAVVLLLAVLGRPLDAALVLAPVLLAIGLTLAASVLLDQPLDLANIIALPLLLGLSNAYGIYLILRLRSGVDLDRLYSTNTPRAVLFSALTAIVSFGTLATASHRGLSGMGVLVALSLTFAVIASLAVLPALVAALERWRPPPGAGMAAGRRAR